MPNYEFTRIETTSYLVVADTLTDAREKLNVKRHLPYGDARYGDVRYWPTKVEWVDPVPDVPEDEAEGAERRGFCGECGTQVPFDPKNTSCVECREGVIYEDRAEEVRVPVEACDHHVMPSEFDVSPREKPEISGLEGER